MSSVKPEAEPARDDRADDSLLAVIPARGGSKRIPKKNIRLLLGKPMIAYTIEAAVNSGLFRQVVVSTDSDEIAEAALTCGAQVPFKRSSELADDVTPVSAATLDVLQRLDSAGDSYTYVCQLMPNCPLRDAADIKASWQHFQETGADVQLSVVGFAWQNPWWALRLADDHTVQPLFPEKMRERSQDLSPLFSPTGAVWWAKADVLRRVGTFYAGSPSGWEISWTHGIDIDTEDDWELCELLGRGEGRAE